ncbi:hypothetical protein [Dongia sp.]|uniref:hypothetical protein n=1 Tax=Dongia sp. TaxID=1977262 RepID=UPI003751D66C
MKDLRLPLDDTTFAALAELGRSVIPAYAPDWTDHNIHDPGIMLIELMAWVAEAQIYSLSRMRRDERTAYAGLMGLHPRGPRPSRGLVWPDPENPWSPQQIADGLIAKATAITPDYMQAPDFQIARDLRLTPAVLVEIRSEFADGRQPSWTKINNEEGGSYLPFGAAPAPGDRLVLAFSGRLFAGSASDAMPISIGVELAGDPAPARPARGAPAATHGAVRLAVTLEDGAGRRPVELVEDGTRGLSRGGVLLLRIPRPVDTDWRLVIQSATGGFLLPPRVQRIAPNVLPVEQGGTAFEEIGEFGTGRPDQVYELQNPDLSYGAGELDLEVKISKRMEWKRWRAVADLSAEGPAARVYVFDPIERTLRFGNGINGAIPELGAAIQLQYPVSAGARGNLPARISWQIAGTNVAFGKNSKPTAGGEGARDLAALQSLARSDLRLQRPIVNRGDLEQAARSCADLKVTRAQEIVTAAIGRRYPHGTRVLLAVGPHDAEQPQRESADWLKEIRARLAPNLPLGQRLIVIAPRYVDVRITAELIAAPKADPAVVQRMAIEVLKAETALVAEKSGDKAWPLGRDLAPLSVAGWLRKVAGVAQVKALQLFAAGRDTGDKPIVLGATGLPRLAIEPADIAVKRAAPGGDR